MAKDEKKLLAGFNPISEFTDQLNESSPQQHPAAVQASVTDDKTKRGRPRKDTKESTDTGDTMVVRLDCRVVLMLDYLRARKSMRENRRISRSEYIEYLLQSMPDE